ncbi:MAG TPA: AI-2E family transporter [Phototrophicaceae bacterium]|nr:AI-2E family transporter [Phototrophicaceae bacterium]
MTPESNGYAQTTRWVLVAIMVVVLLAVTWSIRSVLLLTFAAVIMVVFFTIPVRFLARFGVRRTPAIFISIVAFILFVFLLARVALPSLIEQFGTLTTVIVPEGAQELIRQWNSGELFNQSPFLADTVRPLVESLRIDQNFINNLGQQLASAAGQISGAVLPFVGDVASTVLSILVLIFLSMYFLADPHGYSEGFIRLFPRWYRDRVRFIMDRINFALQRWLEGTFLSMIFVGIGTWIGLSILQLEQAAALGVIAGVMSFVPNFGQLIAVLAAIVVGIVQAPENLGWIIVMIYGISFIQSQIFSPILFAESINLPPVMVLLGQIIAGALFGFIGILLAVPITAIVMILVQEVYIKDILGDVPKTEKDNLLKIDDDLLPDTA